ncbi:hypothetical protein J2Z40_000284 [Cytobacillus eiseniae]|uniref:Uncharacterized protein n=1 Tax=Cytobacillus eiseniae TaxID=762947 RepID=A0ABS4RA07_9BACI|nr:hypothetical protein [Cytobacillus eiseniae]MBP2239731.1 hypothetical protein [Cytobacillus eiseniae]
MNVERNIPEMALLLESVNGAYTTDSIVTNSVNESDITSEYPSNGLKRLRDIFED